VALKILNADLVTNKKARERLETEARLLARLQHPNVLAIYDLLDVHNSLALVLEHMPGGTLADRLREQRPSVEQVVTWMTSLLAGMEAVHEAKLVHRDIKPQNVLLTAKGIPKLADLGIARDTQSRGMTKTGARMGTAEYMSPEQIRGVVVDASSDIYACGIVLYELLTGSVPFAGDSEWKVMSGHMNGALDLSQLAGCPTHLVKAIERAMQKQPEARWGSAAEFSRALLVAGPAAAMGRKIQVAKRVSEAKVYDVEAPGDLGRKCVAHLDDRWCMIPTSKSSCNFGCSSHMDPQDS
ncbi:MAG: serine/threonine-protein kinase, partial [Myxococcales bacterium]